MIEPDRWSRLSGRERQVLDFVAANMPSMEIAVRLALSKRTIDNHCVSIVRELGVSDRFEAARLWQRSGERTYVL
jgi:DNA-binding CsgD family transcriptional regulator